MWHFIWFLLYFAFCWLLDEKLVVFLRLILWINFQSTKWRLVFICFLMILTWGRGIPKTSWRFKVLLFYDSFSFFHRTIYMFFICNVLKMFQLLSKTWNIDSENCQARRAKRVTILTELMVIIFHLFFSNFQIQL